jgi:hypothetical protein
VQASHRWVASRAGCSSRAPAKGHVRGTCCRCHSRLKIRARFSSLRAVFSSLLSVRSTMQGFKKTWIGEIVYSYLPEIPLPMFLLLGRSALTWHASCALSYHKTLPVPICSENLNLVRHVCAICSLKIRTNIGGFITAHGYAGLQVLRQRVASCAHLCTGCLWLGRSLRSSGAAATSTHGVTGRVIKQGGHEARVLDAARS